MILGWYWRLKKLGGVKVKPILGGTILSSRPVISGRLAKVPMFFFTLNHSNFHLYQVVESPLSESRWPVCFFLHLYQPFNSQDLIVNSPLYLLHISLYVSYKNLMLDHGNNFYLISLSTLITCTTDNVWTF